VPCALQLKCVNGAIGKWMKDGGGPEDKLMANTATELISQWIRGLELVDEGMQREVLSEESRREWQRLVPFMVGSFQIARNMVQKVTFSDQASLDQVYSSGLVLPLRFLLPFGDVAATWQLQCTLQAARLLLSQKENKTQEIADTVVDTVVPPTHFTAPSHDVRLSILQSAGALFAGEYILIRLCSQCPSSFILSVCYPS